MEHRIITGGDVWLPFARSRVKALQATGLAYASQQYEIDGCSVKVRITPGHEYISLSGGSAGYEFFTADKWYVMDPYDNGTLAPGTRGAVNTILPGSEFMSGSGTSMGRRSSRPVFAMTLAPDPNAPRWPVSSYLYLKTTESTPARRKGEFATAQSWADQNFQQYHWWKGNSPGYLVTSTGATGRGRSWTSMFTKPYAMSFSPAAASDGKAYLPPDKYWVSGFSPYLYLRPTPRKVITAGTSTTTESWTSELSISDRTVPAVLHEGSGAFDIWPAAYTAGTIKTGGHKRSGQVNWRHAAVQTVKSDAFGSRDFFISTDTHGAFTIYPARYYPADGNDFDDIPDEMVQVVRPEYPAWVTVTPDSESTAQDHWQWAFDKDARLATSTPLNKKPYVVSMLLERKSIVGQPGYRVHLSKSRAQPIASSQSEFDAIYRVVQAACYRLIPGSEYDLPGVWGSSAGNTTAVMIDGVLIPTDTAGDNWDLVLPLSQHGLNASYYEPILETTPGFVEASISISITGSGAYDFSAAVSITDSEQYSVSGKFFMDAAYYVRTKRTEPVADEQGVTSWAGGKTALFEPEDNDLLTGEIVVFSSAQVEGLSPQPYTPNYLDHRAAGLASVGLGHLGLSGVYAYYDIRRRSDNALVKRMCLAHNVEVTEFIANAKDCLLYGPSAAKYPEKVFYGVVEQAEIRFLSFLTASYSRRFKDGQFAVQSIAPGFTGAGRFMAYMLRPRFELRIHGDDLRTIDYSHPDVSGFAAGDNGFGPDPMSELVGPPAGAVDRSTNAAFSASFLMVKQYLAAHHFAITHLESFAFSPSGSWAVYADRRAVPTQVHGVEEPMPLHAGSTESTGVFDVVHDPQRKEDTSHMAAFNEAFGQSRGYDYYDPAQGDLGGFGSGGIWAPYT